MLFTPRVLSNVAHVLIKNEFIEGTRFITQFICHVTLNQTTH